MCATTHRNIHLTSSFTSSLVDATIQCSTYNLILASEQSNFRLQLFRDISKHAVVWMTRAFLVTNHYILFSRYLTSLYKISIDASADSNAVTPPIHIAGKRFLNLRFTSTTKSFLNLRLTLIVTTSDQF